MDKERVEERLTVEDDTHKVWDKFERFLNDNFGEELNETFDNHIISEEYPNGIFGKFSNSSEVLKRLVGYEALVKIEDFIKKEVPEIKIVHCDDNDYTGSTILLIPHPNHGITVMFIPQCSMVQNTFFLYENRYAKLMKELAKMKKVYKNPRSNDKSKVFVQMDLEDCIEEIKNENKDKFGDIKNLA
jgi:hypothetical protein